MKDGKLSWVEMNKDDHLEVRCILEGFNYGRITKVKDLGEPALFGGYYCWNYSLGSFIGESLNK